jgi:phosphoenolpyruvate-protein kinase (PTS system EI component)
MFLDDPALLDTVQTALEDQHLNAEAAWSDAIEGTLTKWKQWPTSICVPGCRHP